MPTYPTKKGLHVIRRMTAKLAALPAPQPVCERCERDLRECSARFGGAELQLECRDHEIELLKAKISKLELALECHDTPLSQAEQRYLQTGRPW